MGLDSIVARIAWIPYNPCRRCRGGAFFATLREQRGGSIARRRMERLSSLWIHEFDQSSSSERDAGCEVRSVAVKSLRELEYHLYVLWSMLRRYSIRQTAILLLIQATAYDCGSLCVVGSGQGCGAEAGTGAMCLLLT